MPPKQSSKPPPQVPPPPQVCTALEYLSYVKGVTVAGRELDVLEMRTRDAALEVVRGYLSIAAKHIAGREDALEQDGPPPVGKPSEN